MKTLKIVAYGTEDYIKKYSKGLVADCKKYNYNIHIGIIPAQVNIYSINNYILNQIVEYIKNTSERICLMDPECRIVKPIPQEWIDADCPVVFKKIGYEPHHYFFDKIIGQPLFCDKKDYPWMQWWWKALQVYKRDNEYPWNETLLPLALSMNNVKTIENIITYTKDYSGLHQCVKGTWTTKDTIFHHPDLHVLLDKDIMSPLGNTTMIPARFLHNHCNIDLNTLALVDSLMFKEITDITKWPKQTQKIRINTTNWYALDSWMFDPYTGRIKHTDYPAIGYHYCLESKLARRLKTPQTQHFLANISNTD